MTSVNFRVVLSVGLMATSGLSACSPVNFRAVENKPIPQTIIPSRPTPPPLLPPPPPPPPGDCTSENVEKIYRHTKLIFVVDTSGSNDAPTNYVGDLCGTQSSCTIRATDPNKSFRGGVISDFLQRYRHKTNFNWGFITFADKTAWALTNYEDNPQLPMISVSPFVMRSALDDFYLMNDSGKTPYRAAFSLAAKAIRDDQDLWAASKPNYYVILLTDGRPTDYLDSLGRISLSQMNSDIKSLLAIAPGRVNLSTIFYSPVNDPTAIDLLRTIANMGGGQFAFANLKETNSGFKIDDIIPGSNQGCL